MTRVLTAGGGSGAPLVSCMVEQLVMLSSGPAPGMVEVRNEVIHENASESYQAR